MADVPPSDVVPAIVDDPAAFVVPPLVVMPPMDDAPAPLDEPPADFVPPAVFEAVPPVFERTRGRNLLRVTPYCNELGVNHSKSTELKRLAHGTRRRKPLTCPNLPQE